MLKNTVKNNQDLAGSKFSVYLISLFTELCLSCCPAGKILVDVSNNRRLNQYPESNAEYLASLLPDSVVVKGFNGISAWAMQQSCPKDASTQVQSNIFYSAKSEHKSRSTYKVFSGYFNGFLQFTVFSIDWNCLVRSQ